MAEARAVEPLASAEIPYRPAPIYGRPGDTHVIPLSVNSGGDAVGYVVNGSNQDAFCFPGGTLSIFQRSPNASMAEALSISDTGVIAGWPSRVDYQGFLQLETV